MRLRVDGNLVQTANDLSGQWVEPGKLVDLVAKQTNSERVLFVRRHDFDDVAANTERAAPELHVVSFVLDLDQLAQDLVAIDPLTELQRQQQTVVRLGRAQTVDARDAGDDDDVAPLEERTRRREPHAVDLVVDGRFLLDVRVGCRNVGFRLVVVVVADEVFDGVLGKEALELLIELRGQRLVVRHDQRGPVHLRQHLGHREGLARSGHTEQHLVRVAPVQALDQLGHGTNLVPADFEIADELESIVHGRHGSSVPGIAYPVTPQYHPSAV